MRAKKNFFLVILILLISLVIGDFLGQILSKYFDVFNNCYPVRILSDGANPWIFDLNIFRISFGLVINFTFGSIIGLIIGMFLLFKR